MSGIESIYLRLFCETDVSMTRFAFDVIVIRHQMISIQKIWSMLMQLHFWIFHIIMNMRIVRKQLLKVHKIWRYFHFNINLFCRNQELFQYSPISKLLKTESDNPTDLKSELSNLGIVSEIFTIPNEDILKVRQQLQLGMACWD